jgi:hypothetical protein
MKRHPTRRSRKRARSITAEVVRPNPKLADKWYEYLDLKSGAAPATIDYWLNLANNPPKVGSSFNFEIRNYRFVPMDQAEPLIDEVRAVVSSVARLPRWAGYDPSDRNPFQLFLAVLQTVPPGRVRACIRCDRYFLAKRKDKHTCSRECANVARVQRYREKWRLYKANRKQERDRRKRWEEEQAQRRLRELRNRPR